MVWSEMSYNQIQWSQSERLETEPEDLFEYNPIQKLQVALDEESLDYFSLE